MRDAQEGGLEGSRRALLGALRAGAPTDVGALVGHARRLGFDLSAGAVAVWAVTQSGSDAVDVDDLLAGHRVLAATMGEGRVCALAPLSSALPSPNGAEELAAELAERGMHVAVSTPRRDPESLHQALREAELLVELAVSPEVALAGQEDTYRLLVGILLRDPEELERLRTQTISPVSAYDARHDTELLTTLQAFLAHHGSTTETAEALRFHRHTVGYRLARVHEVSGLSPYESDGRERLSLGLKAHHILEAWERVRG
jgi:sugar diacid utilization regulator